MGWIEDLARRMGRDANISAAVNVDEGRGSKTSVRSRQRIVQRNGETVEHTKDVHITHTPTEESDDPER